MEDYRKIAIELGRTLISKAPETREDVERMLPELKESEDERIRKELIQCFSDLEDQENEWYGSLTPKKIVAWLERQGEHANFRDSIQVGDKVTKNEDGVLVNLSQLKRVAKKDEQILANSAKTCKDEQKPTDVRTTGYWHVEDVEQKPVEWSEEDEKAINDIMWIIEAYRENGFNETHIQMADSSEKWLKSLKDKALPQPKQEWSEEDERLLQIVIDILDKEEHRKHLSHKDLIECVRKLKSLKPQSHWKPSDEQMQVLVWCMPLFVEPKSKGILESLYQDLKKLKE